MEKVDSSVSFHPELMIGLLHAVGTDSDRFIRDLQKSLERASYTVEVIRVSSDVMSRMSGDNTPYKSEYDRINKMMDAGNKSRAEHGDSVLAQGVVANIYSRRLSSNETIQPKQKAAFIISSLKRPEEVEFLRVTYPSGFLLIGVHQSEQDRRQELTRKGLSTEQVDRLLDRDADESEDPHGQRLRKTFHLADFFIDLSSNQSQLACDIDRIVDLWFGNPFQTPTFDEHAMFMAFSSALRSADLSRQVGAVVAKDKQILSTGANDCPKAGGGLYWPDRHDGPCIRDLEDGRDYMRKDGDSNRAEQVRMINSIANSIGQKCNVDTKMVAACLEGSPIRDLTEFGRVVHAEMEAILSCARNCVSTVGATLYCTTFPCHNCAKHIVAAGIERVVYVEPYPKSKALEFHDDSIAPPGTKSEQVNGRVRFEPFVGIGPRRFFDLFSMQLGSSYPLVRKNDESGQKINWSIQDSRSRIQMAPRSYLDSETEAATLFLQSINAATGSGKSD
ncbi:CMP/dCMP deaminase zinc-binding protein [Planctopirus limnophila DSM 3776]|uniref:CMP/dCMP deaminase zinc-binding protein n=1 Tax=Planctopirus limnophila (strain ATCC 43296 / DSM 3776 / IFAM 1008 / Mu 290) TaxID=521674 RepID=D5SVR6_PLAL2|nr:anti-phage dCTP deaminase [Planctopirus limnophila]ADG69426.1 CMP/dCMP deaminase zinc-binding protein [Planctopirus limnophila DSM 3776]